jgi:hypothetical protein
MVVTRRREKKSLKGKDLQILSDLLVVGPSGVLSG